MKTIVLKLTEKEYNTISFYGASSIPRGFKWIKTDIEDKSHMIEIGNVDKFREFLTQPIHSSNYDEITKNLKSILSKLNDAVRTITLKLTDAERLTIDKAEIEKGSIWNVLVMETIVSENKIRVLDVDKFREFLFNEMDKNTLSMKLEEEEYINLKSILSKLDKAEAKSLRMEIDKEFDKNFPDGQKIDDLQNTLYKLDKAVVQNDEPKCTKCGSEFEDEIWKTPATDYEEYICSNDKCCAVHTISIETHQFQPQLDIERFWDTLEFSYIWEQGLKKDEPKSYTQKVNEEIECIKFEQKQYHGDLDILKEGFIDSEYNDDVWCEKEWDGLGITYESVRQCKCSDCGKSVSELELRLFRKHSKVDEDLCKDCHSKSTANLSMKEMAELVMEYLPCQKDNDIIYTLEHQFKTRGDLAFILMAVSKNKYQVRDDIWS